MSREGGAFVYRVAHLIIYTIPEPRQRKPVEKLYISELRAARTQNNIFRRDRYLLPNLRCAAAAAFSFIHLQAL